MMQEAGAFAGPQHESPIAMTLCDQHVPRHPRPVFRLIRLLGWAALLVLLLPAAEPRNPEPLQPAPPKLAGELTLHAFADDMPQSVLNAFAKDFGVAVRCLPYQSPEEADANIRKGNVYDVVVLEHQLLPSLIKDRLLAEINLAHVPNFKNISANFRDLSFDPGNRCSIPASYGSTGLIVRTDLVGHGVKRWADLWQPRYAGKIGLRAQPREVIGMTLLSLGYGAASEQPQELEAALRRLLALRPAVVLLDIESEDAVDKLLRGEIAILHGYAEDYHLARAGNPSTAYTLPEEGTVLWGESYAIPANSGNKNTAEILINFLLRPDVAAQIINEKKYAQPNDPALAFVQPYLRNDPVVFPPDQALAHGALIQPLSPTGQRLYDELWAQFLAARR